VIGGGVPAVFLSREFVAAGGLLSYGLARADEVIE